MSGATLSAMHRSELEATVVSQTKIMERFRNKLSSIVLGIEDEGDRAYFGSTNDADELRDIEREMRDSLNILECPWMHGRDLHATIRDLRSENERLSHAANCHPDLVEALEGAIGALEFSRDYHSDLGNAEQAFAQDKLDAARAALAKAREGGGQ